MACLVAEFARIRAIRRQLDILPEVWRLRLPVLRVTGTVLRGQYLRPGRNGATAVPESVTYTMTRSTSTWPAAGLVLVSAMAFAGEEFLYRAEFDDGRAPGWDLKKTSKWSFENGVLIQENVTPQYTVLYRIGHASWTDFEVRARVRFLELGVVPGKASFFRIRVRGADVDLLPGRAWIWWIPVGETRARAVHKQDPAATFDPSRWYEVSIRYRPSRLTLSVDGKPMAELRDPPPNKGDPITIYFGSVKMALDYFRVVDKER